MSRKTSEETIPGERIRKLRETERISQPELASLLGVAVSSVSRFEHDDLAMGPQTMARFLRLEFLSETRGLTIEKAVLRAVDLPTVAPHIVPLNRAAPEMLAMLKELADSVVSSGDACPFCDAYLEVWSSANPRAEHKPSCTLAALIAKAEGRTP